MWTADSAIEFCRSLQKKLGETWCVALAGGCLLKDGERKDLDIVLFADSRTGATLPSWLLDKTEERPWGRKDLTERVDYMVCKQRHMP